MNTKFQFMGKFALIAIIFAIISVSCQKDDLSMDSYSISGSSSITIPDYDPPAPEGDLIDVPDGGKGGNLTCGDVADYLNSLEGYEEFSFDETTGKLDYDDGEFDGVWPDGLNVQVINGTYVSFDIDGTIKIGDYCYVVGAVIVKGGNDANVYFYENGILSDEGLHSPVNASGKPAGLSNLTFCLIKVDCPVTECEWVEETAFGGDTAGAGSAWWFAFDTEGDARQDIYAGQKPVAGAYVEYDADNDVLTIVLGDNMKLQDVTTEEKIHPRTGATTYSENNEQVKVQGYDVLPDSRPSAGQFTTYKGRGDVVPGDGSRYYVIHLDVEVLVCEEE
jgi:hypothetical protein